MLTGTQRKEEILQVSQRLFREQGYASTSMRDIASALGMEPASLYSHIKSKEDLLAQTCFEMAEKFLLAIDEVNDIYFDAEQKVKMAVENHVEILTSNLNAAVVFVREWRHLSEPAYSRFLEMRHRYEAGIREIIQTGINENKFNEVDKKFAALTILSSVNWIVEWYRPEGSKSSSEIAAELTRFILTGLKKESII